MNNLGKHPDGLGDIVEVLGLKRKFREIFKDGVRYLISEDFFNPEAENKIFELREV